MDCLTDRFWQMTAGFVLTVFIAIILMFFINIFWVPNRLPEVISDNYAAGGKN